MEVFVGLMALGGMLLAVVVWLLPILLIAASSRTGGGEKLAWILAVIFVSWFAWVFYLLLAPIKEPRRPLYRDDYATRYRY
ncbi:MAG TPA: hypothetical protein VF210_06235 [Pseudomonadales bacterium]